MKREERYTGSSFSNQHRSQVKLILLLNINLHRHRIKFHQAGKQSPNMHKLNSNQSLHRTEGCINISYNKAGGRHLAEYSGPSR